MPQLVITSGGSLSAARSESLRGVVDLRLVDTGSALVLLALSRAGAALTHFSLTESGAPEMGSRVFPSVLMQSAQPEIGLVAVNGQAHVMLAGLAGTPIHGVAMTPFGEQGAWVSPTAAGRQMEDLTSLQSAPSTGFSYGAWRDGGLSRISFTASTVTETPVTLDPAFDDVHISRLFTLNSAGTDYVVMLSDSGNLVGVSRVEASGDLTPLSAHGPADGLWVSKPSDAELLSLGGHDYVVVASAGSSSLSVMRLDPQHGLVLVDHVLDTEDTLFEGVVSIAVAQVGDEAFVIAGGSDDGVTLFRMLPGGHLLFEARFSHQPGVFLDDVMALELAVFGRELHVLAADEIHAGLSRLTVELGAVRQSLLASAAGGVLAGGSGHDILAGDVGADDLRGGAGDDVLMDGEGADTLSGGAGADRFILWRDGATDRITDFDPTQDLLDLSRITTGTLFTDIVLTETAWGAIIEAQGEILHLYRAGGGSLSINDLAGGAIVNTGRVPVDPAWTEDLPLRREGGAGDDSLRGGGGGDTLIGGAGRDTLDGLGGADSLVGDDGFDLLLGGAGDDSLWGGLNADNLFGGDGNDRIEAGDGADRLLGELGNDLLLGGNGADVLFGSLGQDTLNGNEHDDRLYGGGDDDHLYGEGGKDAIWGEFGNDVIDGGSGADTIDAGSGNDQIQGGAGEDSILGANGNDLVHAGVNGDWVDGGIGDDTLHGEDGNDYINGGANNDLITGGAGFDTLYGGNGADTLEGGDQADNMMGDGGADRLSGGAGFDRIFGGTGHDLLLGEAGPDALYGDLDNDTLWGGEGDDRLFGGAGFDLLQGGDGNDELNGNFNADNLYGEEGNDTLIGGDGFDRLFGGNGDDSLQGDTGPDALFGEAGDDTLSGGVDDDRLNGGAGFDRLTGGAGNDELTGGGNADIFVFATGDGQDVIFDFDVLSTLEKLDLSALALVVDYADLTANHMVQAGADVLISAGADQIRLIDVNLADLDGTDFIF